MANAEVVVIGIDNSRWLPNSSAIFKDQCDAIEFYCRAKFEENPDTVVGLFTMSSCDCGHLLYPPTGSLEEIVAKLPTINSGSGQVDLLTTLTFGRLPFLLDYYQDKQQKRMTLFVGGLTNLATVFVNSFGKSIRDLGVAVDVIDLSLSQPPKPLTLEYQFGRRHLEEFINICNNGNDNYNNSHIVHVGPRDSICAVLSESILKKTPRLFHGNVKRRVGGEESSASRGKKYGEHCTRWVKKNRVLEEKNVNVKRGWYMDQFINGNDNYNSHVGPTDSIRAESILKRTFQKDNVNDKRRVGGEEESSAAKLLKEKNVNVKRRVVAGSAARGNKYGQHVTLLKGGALEEKNVVDVKRRVGGEDVTLSNELLDYYCKEDNVGRSIVNSKNRAGHKYPSRTGTKAFAETRHERRQVLGHYPSLIEDFRERHSKNGTIQMPKLAQKQYNEMANLARAQQDKPDPMTDAQILEKVLGKRQGHNRGRGQIVKPVHRYHQPSSPSASNSSAGPSRVYTQAEVDEMMAASQRKIEKSERQTSLLSQKLNTVIKGLSKYDIVIEFSDNENGNGIDSDSDSDSD